MVNSRKAVAPGSFVLYVAVSLDGFVADAEGGLGFLSRYEKVDVGYERFLAGMRSLVMGRKTFEQVRTFGPWPYADKRVVVRTRGELSDPPAGVTASAEPARALAERLRAEGDVWLVGGGESLADFFDEDLVDRLELFLVPELLGAGVPLYRGRTARRFRLLEALAHGEGLAQLRYLRA